MGKFAATGETRSVVITDVAPILDREHFRAITLEDEDLMRELLAALIVDTAQQLPLLEIAIRNTDGAQCARLRITARARVPTWGRRAAAEVLTQLERNAKNGAMEECSRQLAALAREVDRLRTTEV